MFTYLFKSLVRPHLEYANNIWSPQTKGLIKDIESVQRQATKQVPGLEKLSYQERLIKLRLPTLNHRRRRGDLIEMFKIVRGHYDPKCVPSLEHYPEDSTTRGHEYRLKRPYSNTISDKCNCRLECPPKSCSNINHSLYLQESLG